MNMKLQKFDLDFNVDHESCEWWLRSAVLPPKWSAPYLNDVGVVDLTSCCGFYPFDDETYSFICIEI